MRILVVEDEPVLRSGLVELLRRAGHEVDAAGDGPEAVALGHTTPFELAIVDRMLPTLPGLVLIQRLRMSQPSLLVLVLTALSAVDDRVDGFEAGADDYLGKPFATKELLARVEALGRRRPPAPPEILRLGGVEIDLGRLEVRRNGSTLPLTPREAGILRCLAGAGGRVVSRAELLERVWGVRGDLETRTVDVTIGNLRKKIEPTPPEPCIVRSVRGGGYRIGSGGKTP